MPLPCFDVAKIRAEFPALNQQSAHPFIYLDSAATTQKPRPVIDCLQRFYLEPRANVHRTGYSAGLNTTTAFENARHQVADFLSVTNESIIWTRGATEGINLVAQSYGRAHFKAGDEIIVSELEHHANLIPWQLLAQERQLRLIKWPVCPHTGTLSVDSLKDLISPRTKLVALSHISNVTATRNPIEQAIEIAHQHGALVLIDGAQGIVHEAVNLTALDADFYVFSGHKLFAPDGIGVLYAKPAHLAQMPPWHGGGKMLTQATFEQADFAPAPARFEAGTPNILGAISLATAISWFVALDHSAIKRHIAQLQNLLVAGLKQLEGIEFYGLQQGASCVAFNFDGIHYSDLATLLSQQGVAVRAGQHCAHPLMQAFKIKGCIRISIALYNNEQDIKDCLAAIEKACTLL